MKKPVIFIILTAILAFSCKDTERTDTSDRKDIERRDAVKSIIMASLPLPKMGETRFQSVDDTLTSEKEKYFGVGQSRYILADGYYSKARRRVSLSGYYLADQFFNNYSWDVVWPGNIINILSAMNENIVDYPELSKYRSRGTLTLAVVNGNNDLSVPLNNFSKSEVIKSLNTLIRKNDKKGLHADLKYELQSIGSMSEMAYYMGMDEKEFEKRFGESFKDVEWGMNTFKCMILFRQIFFTVLFDDPVDGGVSLFNKNLTSETFLSILGKDYKKPLGYISSVSYGRSFLMLLEEERRTYRSVGEMTGKIEKDIKENTSDTLSYKNIKMFVQQIGGKAITIDKLMSQSPREMLNFLKEHMEFSPDNPGAPISYVVKTLKDLKPVPIPHSIDTSYEFEDYIPVEDKNKVTLCDMSFVIQDMGDEPVGGNYSHISGKYSGFDNVRGEVTYSLDGKTQKNVEIFPRRNVPASGTKIYIDDVCLGEMGAEPKGYIKLSISFTARGSRYSIIGGRSDGDKKQYNIVIIFRYDAKKGEWYVSNTDGATYKKDFEYSSINSEVDLCPVRCQFNYKFKTDQVLYPKKH